MLHIRPYRRNIPMLIHGADAGSDKIIEGLKMCINEFNNRFTSERKSHRTLVRVVEEIDRESPVVYVIVPVWNTQEVVSLPLSIIPEELHKHVTTNSRFFAKVNIDAKAHDELYFTDFTLAEQPGAEYARFLRT